MDDSELDRALVTAAFGIAAERGWPEVSVVEAARAADLPLDRVRARFIGRHAILQRFGRIADQAALAHATVEGSNRDRLFDLVMRRIDVLQAHRAGVLALKTYLPSQPGLALMLAAATQASMAWLLAAAGVPARGWRGALRVNGLTAIWVVVLRAWERDETEDLSATMAALDKALDRAVQAESWLRFGGRDSSGADEPIMDGPIIDEPIIDEPVVPTADATFEETPPQDVVSDPAQVPLPSVGHEPPLPPPPAPTPPAP